MRASTLKQGKPLKPGKPLQRRTSMRQVGFSRASSKTPAGGAGMLRVDAARRAREAKTVKTRPTRKTRSDYLKDAQIAFNAFIRARDAGRPCISCGCRNAMGFDAGHYRSVGAQPALRFHEDNVHRQCIDCNQTLAGNAAAYRVGLIERIGLVRVESLEREHPPAKFTVEDARRIKTEYTARLKAILKNSEAAAGATGAASEHITPE